MFKKIALFLVCIVIAFGVLYWWAQGQTPIPKDISYGVTFSKFRAEELDLNWKETYNAILNDLGVRKLRLVAHWDMVEPKPDEYHFEELDYQMALAEARGAQVILAVGRRLPSWPECHEPEWADQLSKEEQSHHLLDYVTRVVNRYKDSPALRMWQVENEPFIIGYAHAECGSTNVPLLDEEIALVKSLDPDTPILLTGSGELGIWNGTWERGDVFGSTLYRYMWHPQLGTFIYPTTPGFFRAKAALTRLTTGIDKPTILAELATEPWLLKPVKDTDLKTQLSRMGENKIEDVIHFASNTGFSEQYFWGAEWWYYLKTVYNYPDVWNYMEQYFYE